MNDGHRKYVLDITVTLSRHKLHHHPTFPGQAYLTEEKKNRGKEKHQVSLEKTFIHALPTAAGNSPPSILQRGILPPPHLPPLMLPACLFFSHPTHQLEEDVPELGWGMLLYSSGTGATGKVYASPSDGCLQEPLRQTSLPGRCAHHRGHFQEVGWRPRPALLPAGN